MKRRTRRWAIALLVAAAAIVVGFQFLPSWHFAAKPNHSTSTHTPPRPPMHGAPPVEVPRNAPAPKLVDPPHEVTYIVTSDQPVKTSITYTSTDNRYVRYGEDYSTTTFTADAVPGSPWTKLVKLTDISDLSVRVRETSSTWVTPHYTCEIEVDGKTVVQQQQQPEDIGVFCKVGQVGSKPSVTPPTTGPHPHH